MEAYEEAGRRTRQLEQDDHMIRKTTVKGQTKYLVMCAGLGIPGYNKRGRPKAKAAGQMVVTSAATLFAPRLRPEVHPSSKPKASPVVPPAHRGHPARLSQQLNYTVRGRLPTSELSSTEAESILKELHDDVYAPKSWKSKSSHVNTWSFYHKRWYGETEPVLPLTSDKIFAIAAQFKAQGYRSYQNYIDTMCDIHKEQHSWTEDLQRARERSLRSVTRGIGPPKQCSELPVCDVFSLGTPLDAITDKGPICPVDWAVINSFHLTRGAESACALASAVVIDETRKTYTWGLPNSKCDPQAIGCRRGWGCVCEAHPPDDLGPCPYHAMLRLNRELHKRFGQNGILPPELPLFPDSTGEWVSRDGFVRTIEHMASQLGIPLKDELGRNAVGEHVWRISGARHLAALDIPTAVIMRLARWESMVVLRYIADAPLSGVTHVYKSKVKASQNAAEVLRLAAPLPSASSSSSSTQAPAEPPTNVMDDEELLEDKGLGWIRHNGTKRIHTVALVETGYAGDAYITTACNWDANPSTTTRIFELPEDARVCGRCLEALKANTEPNTTQTATEKDPR